MINRTNKTISVSFITFLSVIRYTVMKKVFISFLLLFTVACATIDKAGNSDKWSTLSVSENPDKWYYIDGIKLNTIDSTFDYATKQMRIFGISGKDTVWNTSESVFTAYEIVRRNDSAILMYEQKGKKAQF